MLTNLQSQYYAYIVERIEDGDPPGYSALAKVFGVDKSTAKFHVEALIRKGYLKRRRYMGPLVLDIPPLGDNAP